MRGEVAGGVRTVAVEVADARIEEGSWDNEAIRTTVIRSARVYNKQNTDP